MKKDKSGSPQIHYIYVPSHMHRERTTAAHIDTYKC